MITEQYEANDWQNRDQPIVARAFVLQYQALGPQNAFDEAFLHALNPLLPLNTPRIVVLLKCSNIL